jgi:hypothetical protein
MDVATAASVASATQQSRLATKEACMNEPHVSSVTLWRLPFRSRLHASKSCKLLKLEMELPSPADYLRARVEMVTRRKVQNLPQQSQWRDLSSAIPRLCSCADHLRKRKK